MAALTFTVPLEARVLEVDGFHTYLVGDDALWVHNKEG